MANLDRFCFLAEWKDLFSSVNWKFNLCFYPSDGSVELFDLLKNRLFLKRIKCEGISLDDMFIGSTIKICSRLMYIKDYADSYTRSQLEINSEKTCGFIKPDILYKRGEILKHFTSNGLKIINLRIVQLSKSEACILYRNYQNEPFIKCMIDHLISGPILTFLLLGKNAVQKAVNLIGVEDPADAKVNNSNSIRAQFGTDKIRNAVHVSLTYESAKKDINLLFPPDNVIYQHLNPVMCLKNTTCCVIKPRSIKEGNVGEIISVIEESGFQITGLITRILNVAEAEKFYEIYKTVVSEYHTMVQEICSGLCIILEVKSQTDQDTFLEFRKLVGPLNVNIAKAIRPNSIRARFGKSDGFNAVHVTDLEDDVKREILFLFNSGNSYTKS